MGISLTELTQSIDGVIYGLETNRQVVTQPMLAKAEDWIRQYKDDDTVVTILAALFEIDKTAVPAYFEKVLKLLEVEKKLIFGSLNETLIEGLKSLKGRPVILRVIAALL